MSETDAFLLVLKHHFPNADIAEDEAFFTNEFIDSPNYLGLINRKKEEGVLRDLETALRRTLGAYRNLGRPTRTALERQFSENADEHYAIARRYCVMDARPERPKPAGLGHILEAALANITGREPEPIIWDPNNQYPTLPSATESAIKALDEAPQTTGKAEKEETWNKIALVQHTIDVWAKYGDGPPRLTAKPFLELLQDLADLLDPDGQRGWDASGLVKTYKSNVPRIG